MTIPIEIDGEKFDILSVKIDRSNQEIVLEIQAMRGFYPLRQRGEVTIYAPESTEIHVNLSDPT